MPPEGGDGSEYEAWTPETTAAYVKELVDKARPALDWDETLVSLGRAGVTVLTHRLALQQAASTAPWWLRPRAGADAGSTTCPQLERDPGALCCGSNWHLTCMGHEQSGAAVQSTSRLDWDETLVQPSCPGAYVIGKLQ